MREYKYLKEKPYRPNLYDNQNNNQNTPRENVNADNIASGITRLFFSGARHRRSPENCWDTKEDFGWSEEDMADMDMPGLEMGPDGKWYPVNM